MVCEKCGRKVNTRTGWCNLRFSEPAGMTIGPEDSELKENFITMSVCHWCQRDMTGMNPREAYRLARSLKIKSAKLRTKSAECSNPANRCEMCGVEAGKDTVGEIVLEHGNDTTIVTLCMNCAGMMKRTLSGDEARKVMYLVQKIRRKIKCKTLTAKVKEREESNADVQPEE